jgi:ubiquinone/menaquinone biosynthesis C-methylase UbiE
MTEASRVCSVGNDFLIVEFTNKKNEETIKELKNNSVPGPDGFKMAFYEEFLDKVKPLIKEMLVD